MKPKKAVVCGKEILVFDDVFTKVQQEEFYSYLKNSYYKPIGGAGGLIENTSDYAMQSMFSSEDLHKFNIFNTLPEEVRECVKGKNVSRAYSLCVNYTQKPHFHIDGSKDELTFLYYANTKCS